MSDKPKRSIGRRWGVVLSLVAATFFALWFAMPYIWLPRGTSTISLWRAADTFHQCSRDTPQTDGSYWMPKAHDILNVEQGLWDLMSVRDRQGLSTANKFTQYHRQYIGFTRNSVRLIYVNVFPDNDELEWRDWKEWTDLVLLSKPVVACDGGHAFWGVVYNPKTESFEEPSFNGQ